MKGSAKYEEGTIPSATNGGGSGGLKQTGGCGPRGVSAEEGFWLGGRTVGKKDTKKHADKEKLATKVVLTMSVEGTGRLTYENCPFLGNSGKRGGKIP